MSVKNEVCVLDKKLVVNKVCGEVGEQVGKAWCETFVSSQAAKRRETHRR
jgi:hypothetical protein